MSIDSSEFVSQTSNSSGNRVPPPPFSSQQRKRPALSNLGIEVSLASDIKTPNTPTPKFETESLDSSDAILKVRPTPTIPVEFHNNANNFSYASNNHLPPHHHHQNHQSYNDRDEDFRAPQLSTILEALSDFQNFYDQKAHRIETMEIQLKQLSSQLYQRETELQTASAERIANFKVLETHKSQLRELESQLKTFSNYESIINNKFDGLENLMAEMSSMKDKFIQKESDLTKEANDKEAQLRDSHNSIKKLNDLKEDLEKQIISLEDENREKCVGFNAKMHELNMAIKEHLRSIDLLSGEKEVLHSDLKNITKDRDDIQRECSRALKELTEIVLCSGGESKDLGSLECSIALIKARFMEFNECKMTYEMEIINFKQLINELELNLTLKEKDLKSITLQIEDLRSVLLLKDQDLESYKLIISENNEKLESLKKFKTDLKNIGVSDEFDAIIEKLSQQTPKFVVESLENEIMQMKKQHEIEIVNQKEEYGKLLRDESSKWKVQKDELENEINSLKTQSFSNSSSVMRGCEQSPISNDPNFSAILKDLKESSDFLSTKAKRSSSALSRNSSNSYNNSNASSAYISGSNKRRQTRNSNQSQNGQKMSSPSSVNSNDIWSLFK